MAMAVYGVIHALAECRLASVSKEDKHFSGTGNEYCFLSDAKYSRIFNRSTFDFTNGDTKYSVIPDSDFKKMKSNEITDLTKHQKIADHKIENGESAREVALFSLFAISILTMAVPASIPVHIAIQSLALLTAFNLEAKIENFWNERSIETV